MTTATVASMARMDAPAARLSDPGPFGDPGQSGHPGASTRVGRAIGRRLRLSPRQRRMLLWDSMLALAAVLADLSLAITAPSPGIVPPSLPVIVALSVAAAVPIALRRLALWAAVALILSCAVATILASYQPTIVVLGFVTLTYTAAARFPLRSALGVTVLIWAPVFLAVLVMPSLREVDVPPAYTIFTNILIALVCFFVGRTVHARRAAIRVLEERARVAEENQRTLADQAVAEERRRIARELHDVVAHHVAVMGVLATGVRRVLNRDPGAVDEVLGTIQDTSRTTLREMRRLLDVLRTDAEPAADLTPQPGLAGIESLAEQVRDAGLPVSLRVDGVPAPLDPGVALTIYRIVQEALTNALKHAGSATAEVRLSFGVYWLIVEVSDTGRGPVPDGKRVGHGLVGMRERVALYGGTLRTGPRPGGGYRVYAKMPMEHLGAPSGKGAV